MGPRSKCRRRLPEIPWRLRRLRARPPRPQPPRARTPTSSPTARVTITCNRRPRRMNNLLRKRTTCPHRRRQRQQQQQQQQRRHQQHPHRRRLSTSQRSRRLSSTSYGGAPRLLISSWFAMAAKTKGCDSMLEDQKIQHLISWTANADSFVIQPSHEFSKVLAYSLTLPPPPHEQQPT